MLRYIEIRLMTLGDLGTIFTSILLPPSSLLVFSLCGRDDFNSIVSQAKDNLRNLAGIRSLCLRHVTRTSHYHPISRDYEFLGETGKRGSTLLRVPIVLGGPVVLFQTISQFFSLQLETLSLTGMPNGVLLGVSACATILANLPNLTKLSFESCPSSGSFLKALVVTSTSHLCPRLGKLCLSNISGFSALLIEAVKSRKSSGNDQAGLRKLTLAGCPLDCNNEYLEELGKYIQIKLADKPSDLGLVHIVDTESGLPFSLPDLMNSLTDHSMDDTHFDMNFDYLWP